ncbi:MAG: hypothetical protein HN348_27430, partial [Proteobacteria bacterium]|nr:hypothetical protein [Pseudomonadota bacterium]
MRLSSGLGCAAILLAWTLACTGEGQKQETKEQKEFAPGEQRTPPVKEAKSKSKKEAKPVAESIPQGKGADYSEKWLVIMSSKKELGQIPEGLGKLRESGEPHDVVTLSSTEFKSLMPCYEIVVANSFSKKKTALKYSEKLTKLGVDNYAKNVGKWVGKQAKLDAFCEGKREEVDEKCPGTIRFVEQYQGRTFAHLGLDSVLAERALAEAPQPTKLGDSSSEWISKLSVERLGSTKKDDVFEAWSDGGSSEQCKVAGFVALTRGTPHFGYFEYGDQQKPACGEPEVFAELDCKGKKLLFAAAPGKMKLASNQALPMTAGASERAWKALQEHSSFRRLRSQAQGQADREKAKLKEVPHWKKFVVNGNDYVGIEVHWTTGDANDMCGDEEVNVQGFAIIQGEEVLIHFQDAYTYTNAHLVDADGKLKLV